MSDMPGVRTIEMPERDPLSFADVLVLEEAGLYDLSRIARKYLWPRRRWYRLWRLTEEQRALRVALSPPPNPEAGPGSEEGA